LADRSYPQTRCRMFLKHLHGSYYRYRLHPITPLRLISHNRRSKTILTKNENDAHAYLFNLISVLCRDEPGKLYFSQRVNIYETVKEQVHETIRSAIEKESHGENIPLGERGK